MVLSVLLCAGAVPLSSAEADIPTLPLPAQFVLPSHFQQSSPQVAQQQQQQQPEYVAFLESLVGELSCVFANWVHQNPPVSPTEMYQQQRNTCHHRSSGSPLPDVIPHHFSSSPSDKKMSSVTTSTPVRGANELRVRRGMAPMRFRLNSVGSSVGSAATTPATSPLPYTPDMYYDDDEYEYYHQDLSAASTSSTFSYDDLPPFRPEDLTTSSISAVDATDASPSSSNNNDSTSSSTTADWRRVGRDLRGIADHFASTRHQTHQVDSQSWASLAMNLGSPLTSAGPLMSALAVYLWWKLVRRLTA